MTLIKSISGIRGTIGGSTGNNLTPPDIVKYAAAYSDWLIERNGTQTLKVVIGRDARMSGPMVSALVVATLQSKGIHVVDLGLSTTPTVEIAVVMEEANGGIIITASHNPKQWNALKLLNEKGEFISAEDGASLLQIAEASSVEFTEVDNLGTYQADDSYMKKHTDAILNLPLVNAAAVKDRGLRIVVDAVNSTGALFIPFLLKSMGVRDVHVINDTVNGDFAHNPEPLPENLTQISSYIKENKYDLGIVVDPDVDRLALVDEHGNMFGEEYTLVAVADYVLQHKKGNTVSNLSSTKALRDVAESNGCQHYASSVGEVNVVEKMKEVEAVIGGEGNGGIIYPDLHYGRDALVGIALFLSHLSRQAVHTSCSELRSQYNDYFISKNKIELTPGLDIDALLAQMADRYKDQPHTDIDGLKIEFGNEWVHLRKSNTEPIIRVYAESKNESTAQELAAKIMTEIKAIVAS